MTPVAKGGAALGGCSAIAAGGYGAKVVIDGRKSYVEKWPDFLVPLDGTINATDYASGKFGNEYGRYMSDPSKKENEWWWDKTFKSITGTNKTIQSLFSNSGTNKDRVIDKGFGTEDTALSKICDDIYKETNANIDTTGGANKYKEESVWKYCSPLKNKPQSIEGASEEDEYSDTNSIGKTKKAQLVAIKDTSRFWDFQEARFRGRESGGFKETGSPFKEAYEAKNKSVKELCKGLYVKAEADISSYKNDFWEFCSLSGKES